MTTHNELEEKMLVLNAIEKAKLRKPVVERPAASKPIWQIAKELRQNLSADDLRQLPNDGAVNHDYYIYGTPKVEP